jgi:hypothetical protein
MQNAAPPKLQLAMLTLPPSKALRAILKPLPYYPMRKRYGIFTWSKVTTVVGWIFQPIFYYFLP